jgi:hypothetical protein
MAYNVTIKYTGPTEAPDKVVADVCATYVPNNSYIDTAAYEGTVYDTNVDGNGVIKLPEPFATTSFPFPVPLAQFKLAIVGTNNEVTFQVEDYKEAFYYQDCGKALADQGFEVTVAAA